MLKFVHETGGRGVSDVQSVMQQCHTGFSFIPDDCDTSVDQLLLGLVGLGVWDRGSEVRRRFRCQGSVLVLQVRKMSPSSMSKKAGMRRMKMNIINAHLQNREVARIAGVEDAVGTAGGASCTAGLPAAAEACRWKNGSAKIRLCTKMVTSHSIRFAKRCDILIIQRA